MKIPELKYSGLVRGQLIAAIGLMCVMVVISGCGIVGFLFSEGPFEKGIIPVYDLKKNQDRKILIWIECPRSSGADHDLPKILSTAFQVYMVEKAGFDAENVLLNSTINTPFMVDPKEFAHLRGAGYILMLTVDSFETDFLHVRDYYAGQMVTRALLIDVDLGTPVWPRQPEGKMVQISVDMETEGRDTLVRRLVSGATHCTLRELYPCDKLKYKHPDQRISVQEAYELETY